MDWSFSNEPNLKVNTFTPRALYVMRAACHEAESRGHAQVGDVHLLLGLFESRDTAACAVLRNLDLDPDELKARFASDLKPDKHGKHPPFAPIAVQVIELASAEAARLRQNFVGTEHLLLGILLARGRATQWLEEMGVLPEVIRDVIEEQIGSNLGSEPAPSLFSRFLNSFTSTQPEPLPLPEGFQESIELDFTPRAQQVFYLARKEARRRGHRLDDIHLLFGLCELGQGVAMNVITRLGGDRAAIREGVAAALVKIPSGTGPEKLPEGTYLKTVIALADRERRALNHTYLGTEHIFLGILQAGGPAAAALCHANFDIESARRTIIKELVPNFPDGSAALFDHASTDEPAPSLGNEFTPRVLTALQYAQSQSRELGIHAVAALHVLAGLLSLGSGVAVNVLQQHGVTLDRVQTAIKQVYLPGEPADASTNILYTVAAHDILSNAHQEAQKMNHTLTGTEHLLLAILRSDANSLSVFFKAVGVDRAALIEIVLNELNGSARG